MNKTNNDIESILTDYVLIRQRKEISLIPNGGRWGETLPGFSIDTPVVGLIKRKDWDNIRLFQSIKFPGNDLVLNIVLLDPHPKISKEEIMKNFWCNVWLKLQKETNDFENTIYEFNLLVEVTPKGDEIYRRYCALLGIDNWEEVTL